MNWMWNVALVSDGCGFCVGLVELAYLLITWLSEAISSRTAGTSHTGACGMSGMWNLTHRKDSLMMLFLPL